MTNLPQETIEKIRVMRRNKVHWKIITETFKVSYERARAAIDPQYARDRRDRTVKWKKDNCSGSTHTLRGQSKFDDSQIESRRNWMARQDTRDLTGIIMGDPFPGRSALDRKKREGARS